MTGFPGLQSIKVANTYFQNCITVVNVNFNGLSYTNNDASYAFANCTNLSDTITLPNNVTNISYGFMNCTSFNTIPTIPDSVTNMAYSFDGCNNISGDLYISNPNITNTTNCFINTTSDKTIHIPYYFANKVHTLTYNSFYAAGYRESTENRQHGVILTDDSTRTLTFYANTQNWAVYVTTSLSQINASNNIYPEIIGQTLTYHAFQPGYETIGETISVTENRVINIPANEGNLEEVDLSLYNYTITNDVAYISKYNSTTTTITLPSTTTR